MKNKIKENLFITFATIFLALTLAFSFNAYGQTSGECEACGGQPSNGGDCYDVNAGASDCWETMFGCDQMGGCENGEPQYEG